MVLVLPLHRGAGSTTSPWCWFYHFTVVWYWFYHFTVVLVLPLHRGAGAPQQLHQPFHLRREVPRVPEGRQTPAADTGSRRITVLQESSVAER